MTTFAATGGGGGDRGSWLAALRRYLVFAAVAHLVWEIAHLPLYTIWSAGSAREIAFAVLHCTGGDVLIAAGSLLGALFLVGHPGWPHEGFGRVAAVTVAAGLAYTVFSEWLNTEVRGNWAYADLMPTLPLIGSGVSPLAQWIVIPFAAFWWAQRPMSPQVRPKERFS